MEKEEWWILSLIAGLLSGGLGWVGLPLEDPMGWLTIGLAILSLGAAVYAVGQARRGGAA